MDSNKRSKDNFVTTLLPNIPSGDEAIVILENITLALRQRHFGMRAASCEWGLKRRLYSLLGDIVAASETGPRARAAAAALIDQMLVSGYAQTSFDRRAMVASGAWKPALVLLGEDGTDMAVKTASVRLYVSLSEHVNFYDDFSGKHADFWGADAFRTVLKNISCMFESIPEALEADQWEMMTVELVEVMKALGSFVLFWTSANEEFEFDLDEAEELLDSSLAVLSKWDGLLGKEISAKNRTDPLEELTRLCGILTQFALSKFEDNRNQRAKVEKAKTDAATLLNFLVRVLMLQIPTCAPKPEAGLASGLAPVDECQQDSEWIEGLWEHCQSAADEENTSLDPVKPGALADLFKAMVSMPLEEQRYRLECISPLVPPFIAVYADQLKEKVVPRELTDFKLVVNSVMQDDSGLASDVVEEISFYPCLLDFPAKRSSIHSVCERLKLQRRASDPIRLVVPRDNVLDGVCSSLSLQEQESRIDAPLEIEFRTGYADAEGREMVDEGEDQGGLRRQWLDRASRYFISSDLFMSPSENAAHLDTSPASVSLPSRQRAKGLIFVPSPMSVCKCVQDDWEEQFELFGCVMGFAVLYKETIPVHLGHNFLRSVFGIKTPAQDLLPLLEQVDKTLHTKLGYILDGSYKTLGDTLGDVLEQGNLPNVFAVNESHCPELVQQTPLKENGEQIAVTEENKEEWVHLFLNQVLISGIARQVECFRRGLLRVIPDELVQRIAELMSVKEIELMVCGADSIDCEDWEKHTRYENGFQPDSQPVQWFWEVVRKFTEAQRSSLLMFSTGSSQVPSGGFRFLQPELFTIQRVAVTDRFPEAHTCANTLDLPEYTSKEELERRLRFSMEEAGDAFGRR